LEIHGLTNGAFLPQGIIPISSPERGFIEAKYKVFLLRSAHDCGLCVPQTAFGNEARAASI
jgi:hypothetical protein